MVTAMMVDLIRLLLVHNLVLVCHLSIGLDLCRLNETPLFKDFLPSIFISEELYSEFILELKEFFRFLRYCRLRKV